MEKCSVILDNLVIEKLEKKDLKEAIAIYDDNHNVKSNYEKLFKEYDNIYNNPDYLNIVAKLDGKIVGMATVIVNHDIVEELLPFLTVWNLGVHKDYRRMKIATNMIEYIDDYRKKMNCSFIALLAEKNNKVAQSFYESLNFEKIIGYIK